MTTPTRQEIIEANNALAALICFAHSHTEEADEMDWIMTKGRAITAVLPPNPRPTMADVEWDADKHRFAEAEHVDDGKVIMIGYEEAGLVQYFRLDGADRAWFSDPEHLTPTGKRYALTEVQE